MSKHLQGIRKGPQHKQPLILINGRPGVGKSSMLAALEAVLILDYDDGLSEIDCESIPMMDKDFDELCETLEEISQLYDKDPKNFPYKWIGIDSADKLEQVIHNSVCKQFGWKNIEEPGYGKGQSYAAQKCAKLLKILKWMQHKMEIGVMITCHAAIRTISEPHLSEPYDLYTSKLHKKFAADLYEAADAILFGAMKTTTKTDTHQFGRKSTQAIVTGERVLYTTPSTGIEAKNRYGLPPVIPMDADNLIKLINESRNIGE